MNELIICALLSLTTFGAYLPLLIKEKRITKLLLTFACGFLFSFSFIKLTKTSNIAYKQMIKTNEHEFLEIIKPDMLMTLISFSMCLSLHALSQKRCYMITGGSLSSQSALLDAERSLE
jgi:hypothetical protein